VDTCYEADPRATSIRKISKSPEYHKRFQIIKSKHQIQDKTVYD